MSKRETGIDWIEHQSTIGLIRCLDWAHTGIVPRAYSPTIEKLTRFDRDPNFFVLLTHWARTPKAQSGINSLGGVITSRMTEQHFFWGQRATTQIRHHLGMSTDATTYGKPHDGRLNIFLAPIPKHLNRSAKRVFKWDSSNRNKGYPDNSGRITRFLCVGSDERPPFTLDQLTNALGVNNILLVANLVRTDADVQNSFFWLSDDYRIDII